MTSLLAAFAFAFVFLPGCSQAQEPEYAGTYSLQSPDGEAIIVQLTPQQAGRYLGTLRKGALEWQLTGDLFEGTLVGTVTTPDAVLGFEASVMHDQLELILANVGPDGMPDVENAEQLMFTRVAGAPTDVATGAPGNPGSAGAVPSASDPSPAMPTDPWVGTFSDGTWVLLLQRGAQGYTGQLGMGNEAYPVAAQPGGNGLVGTMTAPTGEYTFTLALAAEGLVMDNAGQQFALRRTTGAAQPAQPQPGSQPAQPSTTVPSPGSSAPPDDSPLAQQWRGHLAGKKVTYISSYNSGGLDGGGMTTRNVYHLCSDGSFGFSDQGTVTLQSPGTPDLGTPGIDNRGSGTWRIVTQGQAAGIELRYHTGEVQLYGLEYRDGATYADGARVYVTPGEACY